MPNFQSSINRLLSTLAGAGFVGKSNANIQKQKEAKAKVEQIQEAKKTQRRNFMEYLRKQPISLGGTNSGTIGDLPKEAQRQIASQYTRSQRKTMMDRMDEEAKKSGK